MFNKVVSTCLLGLSFSLPAFAGTMGDITNYKPSPFYIGAYGGYGAIDGAYKRDGNFAQGRLAFGAHIKQYKYWMFGGEVGVQSGNNMRLNASPEVIDTEVDLLPQATLKPLVDLLFTVKGQFTPNKPLFYLLKGGIAYRQLTLADRTSSKDTLSKVNGEFQAGLGWTASKHVMLTAFYQGIYETSNAGVSVDASGENTFFANIPTQQAGFLGIEYSFS